jgi:hypothetical protein
MSVTDTAFNRIARKRAPAVARLALSNWPGAKACNQKTWVSPRRTFSNEFRKRMLPLVGAKAALASGPNPAQRGRRPAPSPQPSRNPPCLAPRPQANDCTTQLTAAVNGTAVTLTPAVGSAFNENCAPASGIVIGPKGAQAAVVFPQYPIGLTSTGADGSVTIDFSQTAADDPNQNDWSQCILTYRVVQGTFLDPRLAIAQQRQQQALVQQQAGAQQGQAAKAASGAAGAGMAARAQVAAAAGVAAAYFAVFC